MAGAAIRSEGRAADQLYSIGQVLNKLLPEFPGLTPSKVRFLEEEGLISPTRTPAGYRKFSQADVERLQLILSMQRDRYLPLKVIREHLDALDSPDGSGMVLPITASLTIHRKGARLTRDELVAKAGATSAILNDAIVATLITPADVYGDDAVNVLSALVELHRVGIEPRHLRGFKIAAEREMNLIERAVAPHAQGAGGAARVRAAELGNDLATQIEVIRSSLLRAELNKLSD